MGIRLILEPSAPQGQAPTPIVSQISGVDLVVNRLEAGGFNPRRRGDIWEARCPAHNDNNPSLNVFVGDKREVAIKCFVDCDRDSILRALSLTWRDLNMGGKAIVNSSFNGSRKNSKSNGQDLREVTRYRYDDWEGVHQYDVVRYLPKTFRPQRADGTWKLPEAERIPYRLPDVRQAIEIGKPIYCAEGEKDCDALMGAGALAATCNPSGAGKWLDQFDAYFVGAVEVRIIADRDVPGAKHALDLARHLRPIVGTVRLFLPAEGKDATEHLSAGFDLSDLVEVEPVGLQHLVDGETEAPALCSLCSHERGTGAVCRHCWDGARLVTIASVPAERVRWLWPGWLPEGKLVTLDGDPGLGKSTLALTMAAHISAGSPMPDGTTPDRPRDVIVMSAEDAIADTIRPRLEAAGADLERVHAFIDVAYLDSEGVRKTRPPSIPADLDRLEGMIIATDAAFVIIDVFVAFLHGTVNSHSDQDVRMVLFVLAQIAERTGTTFIVLRHLNKSGGSKAVYRGGGSIGIVGAARLGMVVGIDPDDENRCVLAVAKSNLARKPKSMAYELIDSSAHGCARITWRGTSDHGADDLVAPAENGPDDDHEDAASVLAQILGNGPLWVKEALDAMKAAGFSVDQTKRAKRKLRATSKKHGKPGDHDSGWQWILPASTEEGTKGFKERGLGEAPSSPSSCSLGPKEPNSMQANATDSGLFDDRATEDTGSNL